MPSRLLIDYTIYDKTNGAVMYRGCAVVTTSLYEGWHEDIRNGLLRDTAKDRPEISAKGYVHFDSVFKY